MDTVYSSVFDHGSRITRYGEFSVITFPGGAVVASGLECHQLQMWARTEKSRGAQTLDVMAFIGRFQTLLARKGSGVATRGSQLVLRGIVQAMQTCGLPMADWSVPPDFVLSPGNATPKPSAAA